jgi:cytochrome c5
VDEDQRRSEMNRWIVAVLTVTLLALMSVSLLAACGGAREELVAPTKEQEEAAPSTLDGKSLVEERCTACHGLERVEGARKTGEGWKATVERMVGKGTVLNQEEQELVITYLTEAYPQ